MPDSLYIIDANVVIEAANVYYGFDHVPGFWDWLSSECASGRVRSASLVQGEVDYPAELVEWLEDREDEDFFVDVSDPEIQHEYRRLVAWVIDQDLGPEHVAKFLDGADLWIIATAIVEEATVVTQEKAAGTGSRKVKIPDVCSAFGVRCINTFTLISELEGRF